MYSTSRSQTKVHARLLSWSNTILPSQATTFNMKITGTGDVWTLSHTVPCIENQLGTNICSGAKISNIHQCCILRFRVLIWTTSHSRLIVEWFTEILVKMELWLLANPGVEIASQATATRIKWNGFLYIRFFPARLWESIHLWMFQFSFNKQNRKRCIQSISDIASDRDNRCMTWVIYTAKMLPQMVKMLKHLRKMRIAWVWSEKEKNATKGNTKNASALASAW